MDDELREICGRILDYLGDGEVIEIECPNTNEVELAEIPSELRLLLDELREVLEET